ncbi:MAG: PAS domain S-box protein [Ardenticatenaceae bacterium]|nr:PAS domain S-box protein [Ardenticatenaceae bacterium]MCB9445108.1 PAS domain S-box protein [Ardenticatenaceae bacterium]
MTDIHHLPSQETIVIVDDNQSDLQLLTNILSQARHHVRAHDNSNAALIDIQTYPLALIFLNVTLPQMDGFAVCRQLKTNERTANIPVIFTGTTDEIALKAKAYSVGAADYIFKPFQVEEILAKVDTYLGLHIKQQHLETQNSLLRQEIAERKIVEEQLQKSNDMLQTYLDHSYDAVFIHDSQGQVLDVNAKLLEMYLVTREEALTLTIEDCSGPDNNMDEVKARWKQVLISGNDQIFTWQALRPGDSSLFDAEVYLTKISVGDRGLILANVRDITERKQVEMALRTSEERLKQAVRVAGLATFDHDHLTDVMHMSPNFRKMFGFNQDETVSFPDLMKQIHPDDLEQVEAKLQRAHAPTGDGFYSNEHRIIDYKNNVHWLSIRSQTLFEGEAGSRHPVRTIGAVLDVTDTTEAKIALEEAEIRHQLVLEGIGVGIWEFHIMVGKVFFSQKYCELLGCESHELTDSYEEWMNQVHPADRERAAQMMQRHLADREPYDLEYRILTKSGAYRWFQANGQAVWNESGQPVRMTGSIIDIDERKLVEEKLERTLRETRVRFRVSQALAGAETEDAALKALIHQAGLYPQAFVSIFTFDRTGGDLVAVLRCQDTFDSELTAVMSIGDRMPVQQYPLFLYFSAERPFVSEDIRTDKRFEPTGRAILERTGVTSFAAIPLTIGDEWMGYITAMAKSADYFDQEKLNLYQTLAEQGAAALRAARLREAVRESQQRLSLLVQQSPLAVIEWSTNFEVMAWNPAAERVFGYTQEEIVGRRAIDLIVPEKVQPQIDQVWQTLLAQQGGTHNTNENLTKEGRIITCDWYNTPLINAAGQVIGIASLALDITDRKQAEDAVRESKERLSMIVNQIGAVLWTTDKELRCTSAQGAGLASLNLKPEQIIGATLFDHFQTNNKEQTTMAAHNRVLQGESVSYVQTRGNHTFQSHLEPMRQEDGRIIGIVGISTDISESIKVQNALQESQQMLRTVLNTIPVRVFWKDRDLNYMGCNQPFAQDGGLNSPQEIMGMNDFELSWVEQAELYRSDDLQVIQSELPKINYEEPQTDLISGKQRWLRTSKIPLRDVDGTVIGVLGTYEDITDYKQALEALQQANLVVENSSVVLFVWQATEGWPVVMVSQNVTQFGYTQEELLSGTLPFTSMIYPEDLARVSTEVVQYTANGIDRFKQEYRIVTKDGRIRWVDDRTVIERDENGQATFYQGIVLDITERKQAEEEIQRLNEELEHRVEQRTQELQKALAFQEEIMRVSSIGIAVYDGTGQCILANETSAKLINASLEQVLAQNIHRIESWRKTGLYETALAAIKTLSEKQQDIHTVSSFGKEVWLNCRFVPFNSGGQSLLLLTVNDMSEHMRAENEIRELNQQLQAQANSLAAANQELEAFSYSVSHDLRAPLRAIDGYTRILVEDYEPALDTEGQRVCAVIHHQTKQMGELIDDLLTFSRLNRIDMHTAPIDMTKLAASAFQELTAQGDRARIDFQIDELPPAMGDRALIRQVWFNLLSNAIKFSSKREQAVIEVGGRQDDQEIVYIVRDNGAGFDMQYADKLFGVFQRLHGEREFPGTGVGLAIVQRIIHRHGGRIWAESELEQGATFTFTLPPKTENLL